MKANKNLLCPGNVFCCCKNKHVFQKLMEMKESFTVYQKSVSDKFENFDFNLPVAMNAPSEVKPDNTIIVIVIHNTKEGSITLADFLPQFDVNTISCPTCRYKMTRALKLIQSVPTIEKEAIRSVCERCILKQQPCAPCRICQDVLNIPKSRYFLADKKQKKSRVIIEDVYEKGIIFTESQDEKDRVSTKSTVKSATEKKTSYHSRDIKEMRYSDSVLGIGTTGITRQSHLTETSLSFERGDILKDTFKYSFPRDQKKDVMQPIKTSAELIKDTKGRFIAEAEKKLRRTEEIKQIKTEKDREKLKEKEQKVNLAREEDRTRDATMGTKISKGKKIEVEKRQGRTHDDTVDIQISKTKAKGIKKESDKQEGKTHDHTVDIQIGKTKAKGIKKGSDKQEGKTLDHTVDIQIGKTKAKGIKKDSVKQESKTDDDTADIKISKTKPKGNKVDTDKQNGKTLDETSDIKTSKIKATGKAIYSMKQEGKKELEEKGKKKSDDIKEDDKTVTKSGNLSSKSEIQHSTIDDAEVILKEEEKLKLGESKLSVPSKKTNKDKKKRSSHKEDHPTETSKKNYHVSMTKITMAKPPDNLLVNLMKKKSTKRERPEKQILIPPLPKIPVKKRKPRPPQHEEEESEDGLISDKEEIVTEIIYGNSIIKKIKSPLFSESKIQPVIFQEEEDKENIPITPVKQRASTTIIPVKKRASTKKPMNVYRMHPVQPELNWFTHNRDKGRMYYDTGEKQAEFTADGHGRWYYKNGKLALDYYNSEEANSQQRFVIYSSGECHEQGFPQPITILGMFDYMGNGVVYDHNGKTRLKYNQTEGLLLDRNVGPATHWKWHSLNDPPELQRVFVDHCDPFNSEDRKRIDIVDERKKKPPCDFSKEMLAIEFDHFIKSRGKIPTKYKPYQIRMKAMKINKNFSLKVMDQQAIYLIFREGSKTMKLNLGMVLDHKDLVDTNVMDLSEMSLTMEKIPALSNSIENIQNNLLNAQRMNHERLQKQLRMKGGVFIMSAADKLTAATSKPLRTPLLPSYHTCLDNQCKIPCVDNLYYNTCFI